MTVPRIFLRIAGRLLRGRVPDGWRVPLEYYLYVLSRECEPELRHLDKVCRERAVAIDVGANCGYFTYRMCSLFSRVYAFEANPELVAVLESFRSPRLVVVPKALSSRSGMASLTVPSSRGHVLRGWGSLEPEDFPFADALQRIDVELITLDSMAIRHVSLIKIDVEGHELAVLQGARRTIADCRPVVVIEVRERNADNVRSLFADMGYVQARLEDLAGAAGSTQNLIFVPRRAGAAPPPS